MLFISKTILQNCLLLLKWHIRVILVLAKIKISPPPKKFFNIDFRRYETCLSQSLSSLVINLQIEFMSYLEGEFC